MTRLEFLKKLEKYTDELKKHDYVRSGKEKIPAVGLRISIAKTEISEEEYKIWLAEIKIETLDEKLTTFVKTSKDYAELLAEIKKIVKPCL